MGRGVTATIMQYRIQRMAHEHNVLVHTESKGYILETVATSRTISTLMRTPRETRPAASLGICSMESGHDDRQRLRYLWRSPQISEGVPDESDVTPVDATSPASDKFIHSMGTIMYLQKNWQETDDKQ